MIGWKRAERLGRADATASPETNIHKGKLQEMDDAQAFEQFKQCTVKVLGVSPEQVTMEASFAEDLDADSLDIVELVMELEDSFGIKVEESELEGVDTVGAAYTLVKGKLA